MIGLRDIRQAIKQVLELVDGIDNIYGFPTLNPTPPCATVGRPASYDPQVAMASDAWTATIPVQVLVSMADNETADEQLDAIIDLVPAAFNSNAALVFGTDMIVSAVTDQGVVTLDQGVQYLAATFQIEVLA